MHLSDRIDTHETLRVYRQLMLLTKPMIRQIVAMFDNQYSIDREKIIKKMPSTYYVVSAQLLVLVKYDLLRVEKIDGKTMYTLNRAYIKKLEAILRKSL